MGEPKRVDLTRIGGEALAALFHQGSVIEVSSAAFDPDSQMQSTSPHVGDVASSLLYIPEAPSTGLDSRYLFRVAAIAVPPFGMARIKNIRTQITIAQQTPVAAGGDNWIYVNEIPVTTPGWSFKDGNVSWHLRIMRGPRLDQQRLLALSPGQSSSLYGIDSSLLVAALAPRYVAPNGGMPPGDPAGSLGTFRDQRFHNHRHDLGIDVQGPAIVGLFASVWQTDPETRIYLPAASAPADLGALAPEERYVLAWGDGGVGTSNLVRYRHLGGALVAEVGPKQGSDMIPLSCGG